MKYPLGFDNPRIGNVAIVARTSYVDRKDAPLAHCRDVNRMR